MTVVYTRTETHEAESASSRRDTAASPRRHAPMTEQDWAELAAREEEIAWHEAHADREAPTPPQPQDARGIEPGDTLIHLDGRTAHLQAGDASHATRRHGRFLRWEGDCAVVVTDEGETRWPREKALEARAQALSKQHEAFAKVRATSIPDPAIVAEADELRASGATEINVRRWTLREAEYSGPAIAWMTATEGKTRAARPIEGRAIWADETATANAIDGSVSKAERVRVPDERKRRKRTLDTEPVSGSRGRRAYATEKGLRPTLPTRTEAPWVPTAIEHADLTRALQRADVIRRARIQRERIEAAVASCLAGAACTD